MADRLTDEEIDALLCEEGEKSCMRSPFVYFILGIRRKIEYLFRRDKKEYETLGWKLKMLRWKISGWLKSPFVYLEGRLAHWVLGYYLKRYGRAYSNHPESYSIMNRIYDHGYLEEFTKPQMIRKLVNLSLLCRREGVQTVLEHLRVHERMAWFIQLYETNMRRPKQEVIIGEFADRYLEQMETKLTLFVREMREFFHSKAYLATKWPYNLELLDRLPPRKSYTNINKAVMEAYTIEELSEKVSFYTDLFLCDGVLAGERYASEELNPFIKRVLMSIIDGYDIEEVEERTQLDIRCRMNQYKEMLELIDLGFKGIFQGDNPRTLEEKLLFFIEESDRQSVSYFENS
jgi:flagellar motor component MotA